MEENSEEKRALYKKLNAFRADVIQCDWKDDKMVSLGGTKGYPYLSSDKIIKNLAPLLVKHGLELDVEYSDLTDHVKEGTYHWSVKATVFLTDIDTGYTTHSCAYGEGQDTQDKGIAKAQTAAFKKCLSARNMIADGIDPDAVELYIPSNYYKKSAEEQEEVKSKVLEQAVKTDAEPVPEPKVIEKPVQQTIENVKTAPEPVKTEVPQGKFVPVGPQKNAIDKILTEYENRAKAGTISVEDYNKMLSDHYDMASAADAVAFIKKYRV